MSAAYASGRDLSVQKTDLVRGGRVTTKVRTLGDSIVLLLEQNNRKSALHTASVACLLEVGA